MPAYATNWDVMIVIRGTGKTLRQLLKPSKLSSRSCLDRSDLVNECNGVLSTVVPLIVVCDDSGNPRLCPEAFKMAMNCFRLAHLQPNGVSSSNGGATASDWAFSDSQCKRG